MNVQEVAAQYGEYLIEKRRYFHQHPEVSTKEYHTSKAIKEALDEIGVSWRPCGLETGVLVTIQGAKPGKTILLRGDMDALTVQETTGAPYASKNEGIMHACGHDCHTANMLGAARLLKAHEDELEGQVKLMFQPAEETMDGAKMMVENGILKDPDVNAALGIHVFTNLPLPAGTVIMTGADSKMAAVDWFTIKITGKGCHGAQPNNGVDPLNVMSHIHLALQAINAREMDPADNMVLTIGQMHGGNTSNVIPQEAMMSGTIRTLKNTTREMVKTRMDAIVSTVAAAFNAEAHVEYGSGCPVLFHNQELYGEVKGYLGELEGVHFVDLNDIGQHMSNMGSEDFSYVANEVPTVFLGIAAGQPEQGYCYPQHHPKAMFHEDALPVGAAVYAHVAMEWLKNH